MRIFAFDRRGRYMVQGHAPRQNHYGELLGAPKSVVRMAECPLPIRVTAEQSELESLFRMYVYHDSDGDEHVAVMKSVREGRDVPIRIHSSCLTAEVFGATNCDCREQLDMALAIANAAGFGGVVWLHQEGRGNGLVAKAKQLEIMLSQGLDTCAAFEQAGYPKDVRDYNIAAGILSDLGIRTIKLITNNPDKIEQLTSLGIEVTGRIPCIADHPEGNVVLLRDLSAKRDRLGHLIDKDKDTGTEPRI